MSNRKIDEAQGRIEQAVGDLTDDDELKERGERREAEADLKEKVDEVGGKVKGAIDDLAEQLDD